MKNNSKFILVIMSVFVFFITTVQVFGAVASSNNYALEKDSINFGGLDSSNSGSYGLADTSGEIATGYSSSASYVLKAGYRAMETTATYITLSAPDDVVLSSISNDGGGESSGTAQWTVTTNNSSGYSLSIKASTDPALKSSGDSFADYTPAGSDPDFSWTLTAASTAFGFTPEGTDIVSKFKDNGSTCNTGSSDTEASCWDGLSTSDQTIASSGSSNNPSGTGTTVRFRAGVGSSATITEGSFSASVTVTAVTL